MKVILSRKGFDSANGGYPSPILPDGRLISLPIPSPPSYEDLIRYSELQLDRNQSYYDLMKKLNSRVKYEEKWHDFTEDTVCHLDPDIYRNVRERPISWRSLFGQIDAAQTHLDNQGVQEGDVFLFFGWFRRVEYRDKKLCFISSSNRIHTDKHVIFAYLQIGQILKVTPDIELPAWMNYHPHALSCRRVGNNTIYVARECLSWNSSLPGAGTFNYSDNLVLTKDGYSRSKWQLPELFRNIEITYHSEKSWKKGYYQSVGRGQEFVIQENQEIEGWLKRLISSNVKTRILNQKPLGTDPTLNNDATC